MSNISFKPKRILVCNAVETTNYKPLDGGDWIDYWEQKTGRDRNTVTCPHPDCNNTVVVGAHAISIGDGRPRVCIVPLCRGCNNKKQNLDPFTIDITLCVPMPDECLYQEEGKDPVKIDDANKRILSDNNDYIKSVKKLLARPVMRVHVTKSLPRLASLLQGSQNGNSLRDRLSRPQANNLQAVRDMKRRKK